MAKRKSEAGTHADVKELFAAMGMTEPCELCSEPNWDIYHPPERPCPNRPCAGCGHSYGQHTKGPVPDDYCRHCPCPKFTEVQHHPTPASHDADQG